VIALLVGVLAMDGARRARAVTAWVDHTHQVIETADVLQTRIVDAETAQRGFLITGDEQFLGPAEGAREDVARALASLRALTRDNPSQQARLDSLDPVVARRFGFIAEGIRLRRSAGLPAAAEFMRRGGGRVAMDEARALVGRVRSEENRLLDERMRMQESYGRQVVFVVLGGTLVAALLALLANLQLAGAASAEARAGRELALANERLGEQSAELEQQNEHLQEQTVELEMQQAELAAQAEAMSALNAKLEGRVRDLAALNSGLESFSYTVSHDLRTPLGAINGLATLLQEDYGDRLDDTGRGMLVRVRANASHMGELIDGLLELARVSRGDLTVERVDLSLLAREIGGSLARQSPERPVRFEVEDGLTACADRRLLAALVQNLLGNAWKFSAKVPEPVIEVRAWPESPGDTFLVRDNGAGFDMTYAARLFAAFQRLHGGAEFEGTGIGLATVERVARRHGGRVWAEGEVGKGATFYVTLPAAAC
jgi:signal transduction histidine kinase